MKFSSAEDDNMDAFLDLQRAYLKEKARLCKRESSIKPHASLAAAGLSKVRPRPIGIKASRVVPIAAVDGTHEEHAGDECAIRPKKTLDKLPPIVSSVDKQKPLELKSSTTGSIQVDSPLKKAAKAKKRPKKMVQLDPIINAPKPAGGNFNYEDKDKPSIASAATVDVSSIGKSPVKPKKKRQPLIISITRASSDGKLSSSIVADKSVGTSILEKSTERTVVIPKAFLKGYELIKKKGPDLSIDGADGESSRSCTGTKKSVSVPVAEHNELRRHRRIGTPGIKMPIGDVDDAEDDEEGEGGGDEDYDDEFDEGGDEKQSISSSVAAVGAFRTKSENAFGFGNFEGEGCIPVTSCDDGFGAFFDDAAAAAEGGATAPGAEEGERDEDDHDQESRSDYGDGEEEEKYLLDDGDDGEFDSEGEEKDTDKGVPHNVQRLVVGSFHLDAADNADRAAGASLKADRLGRSSSTETSSSSSSANKKQGRGGGGGGGGGRSSGDGAASNCSKRDDDRVSIKGGDEEKEEEDYEGDFDEADVEAAGVVNVESTAVVKHSRGSAFDGEEEEEEEEDYGDDHGDDVAEEYSTEEFDDV